MSAAATLIDALFEQRRSYSSVTGYLCLSTQIRYSPRELAVAFHSAGGRSVTWRAGRALEDELFCSLSDGAINALLAKAYEVVERDLVESHIASKSNGQRTLASIEAERAFARISDISRDVLGKASRIRGSGWFKSVSTYQEVARDIVGPNLATAESGFQATVGAASHLDPCRLNSICLRSTGAPSHAPAGCAKYAAYRGHSEPG